MADNDDIIVDENTPPANGGKVKDSATSTAGTSTQPQSDDYIEVDEPENGTATTVNEAEGKATTVNEKLNETTVNEKLNETTVNEKLNETTVNQKSEETKVNETKTDAKPKEEENDEAKKEDAAEINRKDDDKIGDPEEEKGPFKEGDIIKYMYEDWLIGGLNWLWAKAAKHIKKGMIGEKYRKPKRDAEKKKHKDLERFDTYKMKEKYNDKMLKEIDDKEKSFGDYNGLVEVCDKIRTGRLEETNLSDDIKAMVKAMPQKDFDNFFNPKRIKKAQENIKNNMIAGMQFANMYAQAALLDAKMQNLNHDALANGNDAAFAAFKKEGIRLFAKAMNAANERGEDTYKLSSELLKMVDKAVQTAHKNIDKGNFDGFEKQKRTIFLKKKKVKGEYKPNDAFNKLHEKLQNIDPNQPVANLMEEAILEQDFDKAQTYQFEQYRQSQSQVDAQRQHLAARRKQFEDARARIMNDPSRRAAREALEAQRAIKRQAMIDRMRQDPSYGNPALRQRLLGGGR